MLRLTLIAILLNVSGLAVAQQCRPFVGNSGALAGSVALDGLGYAKYLPTTVKRLSDAPSVGAPMHRLVTGAIMTVTVASIRYRTDGTNPTATNGTVFPSGAIIRWTIADLPKLKEFRFIQVTSGAVVDVDYCW